MMKTIWKYNISTVLTNLTMPKGAELLKVALQDDEAVLWALVDTTQETEVRGFIAIYTGVQLNKKCRKYLDTVQMSNGLVYHIFEDVPC